MITTVSNIINRVQKCADDVRNGVLSNWSRRLMGIYSPLVCGGDLKTFANVYSSEVIIPAYFNHN